MDWLGSIAKARAFGYAVTLPLSFASVLNEPDPQNNPNILTKRFVVYFAELSTKDTKAASFLEAALGRRRFSPNRSPRDEAPLPKSIERLEGPSGSSGFMVFPRLCKNFMVCWTDSKNATFHGDGRGSMMDFTRCW